MSKKGKRRQKHKPQRTCVGCNEVTSKRSMTRIVRTENGVIVDPSGKMPGRGAYLHNSRSCWETGIKSSLGRSLKIKLTPEDIDRLKEFMDSFVEEEQKRSDDEPEER